jgi:hypothetical protein
VAVVVLRLLVVAVVLEVINHQLLEYLLVHTALLLAEVAHITLMVITQHFIQ